MSAKNETYLKLIRRFVLCVRFNWANIMMSKLIVIDCFRTNNYEHAFDDAAIGIYVH